MVKSSSISTTNYCGKRLSLEVLEIRKKKPIILLWGFVDIKVIVVS